MDIDLKTYFAQERRGAMRRLADLLQVNPALVSQWVSGGRPIPPKHIPTIEQFTGFSVRRWSMSRDWAAIWPELVEAPGAPAVEAGIADYSASAEQTEVALS
jgi:DNA-binding transcriptional regulator YdaS (Cro superfamily)